MKTFMQNGTVSDRLHWEQMHENDMKNSEGQLCGRELRRFQERMIRIEAKKARKNK